MSAGKTRLSDPFFSRLLFLFVAVFGFLFALIIPPFQKTDEVSHFYKTVAVATGNFFCQTSENQPPHNLIPKSYFDLPDKMMAEFVNSKVTNRFPRRALLLTLREKTDLHKVPETASCSLPFIFYLPTSIVLALPILLGLNSLVIFYLGRLCFYAFATAIFWISLKVIPRKFQLLLVSCLALPMVAVQISSYNKEVFHLAFGSLAFALFLSLREKFTAKKIFVFTLSLVFLVLTRPQYFPFLALIFLAFKHHKVSQKTKSLMITGVIGVCLFGLAATIFFLPKISQFHASIINSEGVSAPLQLLYLQKFPLRFPSILFNSYTNHIEAYYKSLIGTYGSIHYYLDWWIYGFFGLLLAAVIYHYAQLKSELSKKELFVISAILLISTLTIFFLMYLYATPVGFYYVIDVQGRYFIMMLPYLMLIFSQIIKKLGTKFLIVGLIVASLMLLKNVYDRYYDYSTGQYHQEINVDAVFVSSSGVYKQTLAVNPNKKFRGLSFFIKKDGVLINQPFLLSIYDQTCSNKLREEVMMAHTQKSADYVDVVVAPLQGYATLCYSLEPFGGKSILNAQPLQIKADPQTSQPIALPLYAF